MLLKIGVISDTHGFLDPAALRHFAGVDHILHAGDIGPSSLLTDLESIAPLTAVLGNTDGPLPGVRETEFVRLGDIGFLLHHIVNPEQPGEPVTRRLKLNQPQAVVFGHTHRPYSRKIDGITFFNPGYAGRQRFDLPRSIAVLHVDGTEIREEVIRL